MATVTVSQLSSFTFAKGLRSGGHKLPRVLVRITEPLWLADGRVNRTFRRPPDPPEHFWR